MSELIKTISKCFFVKEKLDGLNKLLENGFSVANGSGSFRIKINETDYSISILNDIHYWDKSIDDILEYHNLCEILTLLE